MARTAGPRTDPVLRRAVVDMYVEGHIAREVAKSYGVSVSTVLDWVRKAGEPVRRRAHSVHPDTVEGAVAMYLEGHDSPEVARAFGVHKGTVLQWVKASGAETRRAPPARRQEAVEMYLSGTPGARVAKAFGVDPKSVLRWVRKSGNPVRPRSEHPSRLPEQLRAAVVQAYAGGDGGGLLGEKFDLSPTTVLKWAGLAGVPIRQQVCPICLHPDREKIEQAVMKADRADVDIDNEYGVKGTSYHVVRHMGWSRPLYRPRCAVCLLPPVERAEVDAALRPTTEPEQGRVMWGLVDSTGVGIHILRNHRRRHVDNAVFALRALQFSEGRKAVIRRHLDCVLAGVGHHRRLT